MPKSKIPTFNIIGGKAKLIPVILKYMPSHHCYVEPFAGSCKVLLAKPPSPVEIINDINQDITNFFLQIRDNFQALQRKLLFTPYSRELYQTWLKEWRKGQIPDDPVERTARWFFLQDTSFSGNYGAGWGHSKESNHARSYFSKVENLFALAKRLRNVQIESKNAFEILPIYDGERTFFMVDPPYEGTRDYYGTKQLDYQRLAAELHQLKGKVLLTHYETELINSLYSDWYRIEVEVAKSSAWSKDIKQTRTRPRVKELLLFNFNPFPLEAFLREELEQK